MFIFRPQHDYLPQNGSSALQNDRQNFSFVKDTHVIGNKWLERVGKRTFVSRKFDASPSRSEQFL